MRLPAVRVFVPYRTILSRIRRGGDDPVTEHPPAACAPWACHKLAYSLAAKVGNAHSRHN
eukprot:scaffold218136_cov34-Prasinocladus_malaysianus.AAC.1